MPFYEYECSACKFYVEVLQKISDAPLKKCPSCKKSALKKLVSAPVFRLKGSGWYETDFKSDQDKKRNLVGDDKDTSSSSDSKADSAADSKTDKAESKTDSNKEKATESKSPAEKSASKSASKGGKAAAKKPTASSKPKSKPAAKKK